MWNMKNLLFGILMLICDIACIISGVFKVDANFGVMGFGNGGAAFGPTGIVVFSFAAFIFLRNSKR